MLSGSELWLLRLMADRGLALLDADSLLILIEERGELRVAASSGAGSVRLRVLPVQGSAIGAVHLAGSPLALDRPRGSEAAWLYELGLEARAALVEPLSMEGQGGLVIALRTHAGFREPDRRALEAFAASVSQRLAAERSVELERLRFGMQARERERTRWAREIHDETIQGLGALRLTLAHARDQHDEVAMRGAVDVVLEGLGHEIDGLRHLITELRPAALDELGLVPALEALARRAQAIDSLEVQAEIELGTASGEPPAGEPAGERAEAEPSRPLAGTGGSRGEPAVEPSNGTRRLDAELESTVYRVLQEALTNVSRHAGATRAVIRVIERDGRILASVTDNGRGIAAGRAAAAPRGDGLEGGFGLSGMRERAELVGGELELSSVPGGGTTVLLTVPLAGRPLGP